MIVQDRSGRVRPGALRTNLVAGPSHRSIGNSPLHNSQTDSSWGSPSISSSFNTQLMSRYPTRESESNKSASSLPIRPTSALRKVSNSLARFPLAIKQGRANKMAAKEEKRAAKEEKKVAEEAQEASANACYQAREERKRALNEKWEKDKWFEKGSPRPTLDQSIDLEAISDVPSIPTEYIQLDISAECYNDRSSRKLQLFTLPSKVRRRIYGFCFPQELRPITLSPEYATKAAFGNCYFATAWSVLRNVQGGLESFTRLRADLLNCFWSEHHFHVTINCFSASAVFHPLQNVWLHEHISTVKNLTIELDYTTLAASSMKAAPHYTHNRKKEEEQLARIIEGLAKRIGGSSIDKLTILCRRYKGNQPHVDAEFQEAFGSDAVPYCPNYVVQHLSAIAVCLYGKLCQFRVVGYDLNYTKALLRAVMGKSKIQHIIPNTPAWPSVPQTSGLSETVIFSTITLKPKHTGSTPKLIVKEFFAKITPKLLSRSRFDTPILPSLARRPTSAPFAPLLPPRPVSPPLIISPPEHFLELRQLLATMPRLSLSLIPPHHLATPPMPSIYSTPLHPLAKSSFPSKAPEYSSQYQATQRRGWNLAGGSRCENESASKNEGSDSGSSSDYTTTSNFLGVVKEEQEQSLKHEWKDLTHAQRTQNYQNLVSTGLPSAPSFSSRPFPHLDRYIPAISRLNPMAEFSAANKNGGRSKITYLERSMVMSYEQSGEETAVSKATGFQRFESHTTKCMDNPLKESTTLNLKKASVNPTLSKITQLKHPDNDATNLMAENLNKSGFVVSEPACIKAAKFNAIELKLTREEALTFKATKSKLTGEETMKLRGLGLKPIDGKIVRPKTAEHRRPSGDVRKSKDARLKPANGDASKFKAADLKRANGDASKFKAAELRRANGDPFKSKLAELKRIGGDAHVPESRASEPKRPSGDTPKSKAAEIKRAKEDTLISTVTELKRADEDTPKSKAAKLKRAKEDTPVSTVAELKRARGDASKLKGIELKRANEDTPKFKSAKLKRARRESPKAKAEEKFEGLPVSSPQVPAQAMDAMTLEQINAMNEKDPAFARGVQVMRSLGSLDHDPTLAYDRPQSRSQPRGFGLGLELPYQLTPTVSTPSALPSELFSRSTSAQGIRRSSLDRNEPVRYNTSMGVPNTDHGILRMKCVGFVNKLRGRNVSNTGYTL